MGEEQSEQAKNLDQVVERIIELQREYYFENKGRDSDRRRKLRDIIESVPSAKGS